jgi:hypothetical protein
MPVPMMLAITIEHAVTKPTVRLGRADLIAAGWVSVVIRREFYSSFLLQNAEHPRFNAKIERKTAGPFQSVFHCCMLCQSTFVSCQKRFQASVCNGMNAHPKLSVETATQLAIFLANRPGALARVCDALANAGVNIYALATSDTVDHTVVRMVVSNPTKALMLLGEAGVLALETDVLTIETASEPGVLGKIAERLAEAEVNIEYAYLAAGREAEKGLIILRLSDVEKARRVLEQL